jgi:hypothetical protein
MYMTSDKPVVFTRHTETVVRSHSIMFLIAQLWNRNHIFILFMSLFSAAVPIGLCCTKCDIIGWLYLKNQKGKLKQAVVACFQTPSYYMNGCRREQHEKSVRIVSAWPELEPTISQMYYHHAVSLGGTFILKWFRECILF